AVSPWHRRVALAACILPAGACDGRDTSASTPGTSLEGATIVESVEPAWSAAEAWRVADDPSVVIGGQSDDARYQFGRVAGALWLGDGTIVVGDAAAKEVRYFDSDGSYRLTVGREGQGPGEFLDVSLTGAVGDTVVVWDSRQSRLTFIGPDGAVERVVPVSRSDGESITPRVLGVFSDGTVAAAFPTTL